MVGSVPVLLAIDQGTTGTTALLINAAGQIVGRGYREIACRYPHPGWVEQDAEQLWVQTLSAIGDACVADSNYRIVAIGIANQRETVVLWDRKTGAPIGPAIVWQCRRTSSFCEELRAQGIE